MYILADLLALLIIARVFGELAERLGQPASAGEILAGITLVSAAAWFGQSLPFLDQLIASDALETAAQIGIFFLLLVAGIEIEPKEVAENSAVSFAVAFGGMIVPLLGGFSLAWLFLPESDLKAVQALLIGIALSISAIPAMVKMLSELGLLHTRMGEILISAAIVDDVMGLFLLAVLLSMMENGTFPDMATLALMVAKVTAFFAITVTLGVHVYPRVSRAIKAMQAAAIEFSAITIVALAYGLLAELLGMHWILGAFMAGLYFEKTRVGRREYNEIVLICGALTRGVLGPLFFVSIGLQVDLSAVTAVPVFLFLLIAVAFLGKLLGAGIPALLGGLHRREAAIVGIGMSARGAVELVLLSIALESGIFSQAGQKDPIVTHLFSSLVIVGVITTLLVPIIMRRVQQRINRHA
ncbi:MAG: cation:proton antiporter [Alphaproteobacteria bacterium]|nr:cation:proton antiporter [Alphaproteobacteria bacterium]